MEEHTKSSLWAALCGGGAFLFGIIVLFELLGRTRPVVLISAIMILSGYIIGFARETEKAMEKPIPSVISTIGGLLLIIGIIIFFGAMVADAMNTPPPPVDISGVRCDSVSGLGDSELFVCRYEGNLTMIVADNVTAARVATIGGQGAPVPKA